MDEERQGVRKENNATVVNASTEFHELAPNCENIDANYENVDPNIQFLTGNWFLFYSLIKRREQIFEVTIGKVERREEEIGETVGKNKIRKGRKRKDDSAKGNGNQQTQVQQ